LEAERVARKGRRYRLAGGKYKAIGRGSGGRWIQVIYVIGPDGGVYIIHARELTGREKKRWRRRKR
jgi:uncharacterized DUF497 family protein